MKSYKYFSRYTEETSYGYHHRTGNLTDNAKILLGICTGIVALSVIMAIVLTADATLHILNPEYFALKEVMGLLD